MGKIIRVTPEKLVEASGRIGEIAESYKEIRAQLLQESTNMGVAWEGEDNRAFVEKITACCDDLMRMANKLELASQALKCQADNYVERQEINIGQLGKL